MKNKNLSMKNEIKYKIEKMCIKARESANQLMTISTIKKNKALNVIADRIDLDSGKILHENAKDISKAENNNLSDAMLDRLMLNNDRIKDITNSIRYLIIITSVVSLNNYLISHF